MNRQLTFLMINDELAKTDRQTEYYVCPGKPLSSWQKVSDGLIKCACKQIYRGNMPVTELYAFNLICENLLAALYGVAHQNKRSFINPLKIGYSEYPIFSLKTETYLNALFIWKENLVDHQHGKLIFFFNGKLVPSV